MSEQIKSAADRALAALQTDAHYVRACDAVVVDLDRAQGVVREIVAQLEQIALPAPAASPAPLNITAVVRNVEKRLGELMYRPEDALSGYIERKAVEILKEELEKEANK